MDFELQTQQSEGRTVVAVSGDLDVMTAPLLRDRLIEVIDRGDHQVLVDLRPTEFLDSSGLSALVSAAKRARSAGGDVALVCPPGNLRRLIEVTALDQVFAIYDSLDAVEGSPGPDVS